MSKINKNIILKIAIFVIASVITVLLIPRETGFRYEIRKGAPWAYPDVIAPHDFPILKSDRQLEHERDSIKAAVKPYFTYDSTVYEQILERFTNDFGTLEEKNKAPKDSLDNFKTNFSNTLSEIYRQYILETLPPQKELKILKGQTAYEILSENCLTEKAVYNKLKAFGAKYKADFYPNINYENYVLSNTFPDLETTELIKNERLKSISLYSGMVQAGERIIAKGELVNDLRYRMLISYRKSLEQNPEGTDNPLPALFGQWIIFLFLYAIFFFSLLFFEPKVIRSVKEILYFISMTLFFVILASVNARFEQLSAYLIPVLILPVITVTFYKTQIAVWHHTLTVVMLSFIVPNGFEYFIVQFISGFAVAVILTRLQRRGQIMQAAFFAFIIQIPIYIALHLVYENSFTDFSYYIFLWILINSIIIPMAYPLMYVFERVFGFVSDVTLIELSDTNRPLLRMLSDKAPGSFQHSMQVANLAEEAVRNINGNTLLVRAGALYHDIGKTKNPAFFTENQLSGKNPHDKLPPEESAKIIISHVTQGLELADKYHLPKQLQEFIISHHADSKVRWFLHAYKQAHKNEPIDESLFQYHGTKPKSKEAAVVMMADAVEAASRSLQSYDPQSISDLVDKLIDYQISEGHFADTNLTFSELTSIRKSFKTKLANIYHSRIAYPDEDDK